MQVAALPPPVRVFAEVHMRLLHSWLCLSLIIGQAACASPTGSDLPVSGATGDSTARQLTEGTAGRITNKDGNPVEGAAVLAAALDSSGPPIPELAIVSDANGRYEWPLRAGHYELTVVAEGYQRVSKKVAVSAGQVATLDFVLLD
jgi:hypothetical protein